MCFCKALALTLDLTFYILGVPSDEPSDPDYCPTLKMGYKRGQAESSSRHNRHARFMQRRKAAEERQETASAASTICDFSMQEHAVETEMEREDLSGKVKFLEEHIGQLQNVIERQAEEIESLKKELTHQKASKAFNFSFLEEKNQDYRTKFFSGLPCFAVFLWLVSLCQATLRTSKILTPKDTLLLIMMKINLNLKHQDLAWRFQISTAKVSQIINHGLPAVASAVKFLIRWPDKTEVVRSMPTKFQRLYPNCRTIIDCTEIFVERATDLTARAMFYSNYKSHPTIKILIGITPSGAVSFVSKCWGGRVSDKVITLRSGLLDLLEPGDGVMADRGFLIDEAIAAKNAILIRPAFTRGQKQMPIRSIEDSRQQSTLRIHIERLNERLKNFDILNTKMPLVMVPHADSILTICAAICNLYPRLIKKST